MTAVMNSRKSRSLKKASFGANGQAIEMGHGAVVIAAITSCTNTSNPSVMLAAGLLAKKAVERGLKVKPYVKTSLAPGSRVVTEYLAKAACSSRWPSWVSILSVMAVQPASAIRDRSPGRWSKPSSVQTWWRRRCYPATAILKAAFTRMCGRIIWPRRPWLWLMPDGHAWMLT